MVLLIKKWEKLNLLNIADINSEQLFKTLNEYRWEIRVKA